MKYVWAVDQHKIAAEVTGLGRVSIWVNGARILRSYALAFRTDPLAFNLPDGREVAIKPTRVLIVNGQELEPLEPFVATCDVCASPLTANETSCGDCGNIQESHRDRRKHKTSLRRARRPLTLLSVFYLSLAINQFVQMCREIGASDDIAVAEGKIMNADAQALVDAHERRADDRAAHFATYTFWATIMGLLALLSRFAPLVSLTLGLSVFAYLTFGVVKHQGGVSELVMLITWPFVFLFVLAFAEARALSMRSAR